MSTRRPRHGDTSEESDAVLIECFERNEPYAAERLYARLVGVVEGTLRRMLGMHDEHHVDLVQAAFEQILTSLSRRTFARRSSLAAWASSVTAHVALNSIRARTRERRCIDRRHDVDAEAARLPAYVNLEEDVAVREELAIVGRQLASMDAAFAATLLLHDLFGHELAEIAALTGTTVAAAQSRLVRGRSELRTRLKKRGNERATKVRAASRSRLS